MKDQSRALIVVVALTFLLFVLLLTGCGRIEASGETRHKVEGEAKVKIEVQIVDCEDVPEERRAECVERVLEILDKLTREAGNVQN
jgi:hypothetical protein